jgi:uncharacterized RDD family membrane protein YckC
LEYPTYVQPQVGSIPVDGVGWPLRAVAKILDLILHNLIGVVFGVIIGIVIGFFSAASGGNTTDLINQSTTIRLISGGFAILGFILYSAICETYYGATLGKLILGMHVVNNEGEAISFGAAMIRALAFFIDQLFLGLIAYSSMKDDPLQRRYGDKWAGTVVVKRSSVKGSEIPSGCMFVFVLLLGLAFDGLLQVLPVLFSMK